MNAVVRIVDETTSGQIIHETTLVLVSERVSVRTIIAERVRAEVQRFNAQASQDGVFQGLVQPEEAEAELNGYRLKKNRQIDSELQIERALDAFSKNGFFLLVDDQQVESLDDEVTVTSTTKVSFLKLIPLVGG